MGPGGPSPSSGRRVPIGDYGIIGDTRSAALVAPDGSIDWWCPPRFDGPPLFGRLLGGDRAGWFSIAPREDTAPPRRAYRPHTATLTTTWPTGGGELEVADSMVSEVEGRLLPSSLLVRRITARGADVAVRAHLAPSFGYGRQAAARTGHRAGALVCERDGLAMAVTSDGPAVEAGTPVDFDVPAGATVTIAVSVAQRGPLIVVPAPLAAFEARRDEAAWERWCAGIRADRHRETMVRSLITLRLLTYSPSGAPVAAPTTSLPEHPGGGRNWDYRYAWPRDASIGIAAFLAAGKVDEARAFLGWLLHASRLARPRLPVLFTLDGRRGPGERELAGWPGYDASLPVRVGNGAAGQHQLDGYGWVVDAAWLLTDAGHRLYGEMWRAVAAFADEVAGTWREPDAGIWEKRNDPAHHVHSKLMGWLALDRAVRIAHRRGDRRPGRTRRWLAARDALAEDIRSRGFDRNLGAYTAAYGSGDLDAAVLVLPVIGFEPSSDGRVSSTVDAIRDGLAAGGPLVYRYVPGSDGMEGPEGAFLPCSFWLVQALALTGRRAEAEALLDDLIALGGPLGLFAEEMDPSTGEQLGNFPQALTHAALVQAVLALSRPRTW